MQAIDSSSSTATTSPDEDTLIKLDNFSAYWQTEAIEEHKAVLRNVDFILNKSEVVSIVGSIGSGKTSLLFAIMKEIPRFSGKIYATRSLAFTEQEPYILQGTLRENILFGKDFEKTFYDKVVSACCLLDDFAQLANADLTIIGEKGSNLSGGQKARVSLARAVYSRADAYLLDDPLSAVDSKVALKIFRNVIRGLLKHKGVILVTHHLNFAMTCDRIVVLENGSIVTQGAPKDIDM